MGRLKFIFQTVQGADPVGLAPEHANLACTLLDLLFGEVKQLLLLRQPASLVPSELPNKVNCRAGYHFRVVSFKLELEQAQFDHIPAEIVILLGQSRYLLHCFQVMQLGRHHQIETNHLDNFCFHFQDLLLGVGGVTNEHQIADFRDLVGLLEFSCDPQGHDAN